MVQGKKVLLIVLAHPDDETFGMGGTLAHYAQAGVEVHLVCATRGEAGTVAPELLQGFASIADLREAELRCAASHLGLTGVHFLGHRDSGMAGSTDNLHPAALMNQPVEAVAAQVLEWIDALHPHVIVTFDPIGGNRHPDHMAAHQAALLAFQQACGLAGYSPKVDPPPARLYYGVFPKRWLKPLLKVMPLFGVDPHRYGRNKDMDLVALMEDSDYPVHARINYQHVAAQRSEAYNCHASQQSGSPRVRNILTWLSVLGGSRDYFMRAYPSAPPGLHETDLFAGL